MSEEPFIRPALRPAPSTGASAARGEATGTAYVAGTAIFAPRGDVQWSLLDGEAVLLNLETGTYYTLNRVGTVIWQSFTGSATVEEILSGLCRRFEVAEETARADLVALVRRLQQEGLVDDVTPRS